MSSSVSSIAKFSSASMQQSVDVQQSNSNNQQQPINSQQNQRQAQQPVNNNQQPVNTQQSNQQQYTEQGHYPMWKEGNVYCAQLPNGKVMKQTFADGSDPGTYQGDPQVQYETAQLQDQWNKEHGIN